MVELKRVDDVTELGFHICGGHQQGGRAPPFHLLGIAFEEERAQVDNDRVAVYRWNRREHLEDLRRLDAGYLATPYSHSTSSKRGVRPRTLARTA